MKKKQQQFSIQIKFKQALNADCVIAGQRLSSLDGMKYFHIVRTFIYVLDANQ